MHCPLPLSVVENSPPEWQSRAGPPEWHSRAGWSIIKSFHSMDYFIICYGSKAPYFSMHCPLPLSVVEKSNFSIIKKVQNLSIFSDYAVSLLFMRLTMRTQRFLQKRENQRLLLKKFDLT